MARLTGKWLADFFEQEIPSGSINGSNLTFTLSSLPAEPHAALVMLDGLPLMQGAGLDYTISGQTITMAVAPALGQKLYCFYVKE